MAALMNSDEACADGVCQAGTTSCSDSAPMTSLKPLVVLPDTDPLPPFVPAVKFAPLGAVKKVTIGRGREPEVTTLADPRGNSTESAQSSLHAAAKAGNMAELRRLLSQPGCRVDEVADAGESPLHVAIGSSNIEAAILLLDNGASVHSRNEFGWSPLVSRSCLPAFCGFKNKHFTPAPGFTRTYCPSTLPPSARARMAWRYFSTATPTYTPGPMVAQRLCT